MEMTTKMPDIQPEICRLDQSAIMVMANVMQTYHRRYQKDLSDERPSLAYVRRSSLHLTHGPGDDIESRKKGRDDDSDKEPRLFT